MAIETVFLIRPRGFCAGVDRAVNTVEEALRIFGAPVYVKHEIVHNKTVCEELRSKGAIFVEEVTEVPEGSICVFSAHGIAPLVRVQAQERKLYAIDATCPLVSKIHIEVNRFAREGNEILYIGHKGHPEVVGVMGIRPDITQIVDTVEEVDNIRVKDPEKVVYLTQTTLSVDECKEVISALKKKFPKIKAPPSDDICYATTNRQTAIRSAAKSCDIIIVVGSKNSSNSNRLVDTARSLGVDAYLVDNLKEIQQSWLEGKKRLGVSAGASAPEYLIKEIADYFKAEGAEIKDLNVMDEKMSFKLPYELYRPQNAV
ncbi:MAG: 4-hydroxy-3-methylbut-2-enyl diphosphate reductase [Candidatus Micrarchaeaceae archaeon]|jgi:4-hydroxy-3-methylbut-2-enyl diphosphate reductase|nr:4-hydroxy-3-methylbut-2-enyl diphosphate reductase [Candidatus Micrarchaeota archaeon]HII09639.1 4-hydroxy-3-methylbut-2-enyl diphosphate reductase [Candidatus Micrarchaeota archaeon]